MRWRSWRRNPSFAFARRSPLTPLVMASQANGGVPPFGHATQLRIFIDLNLLQYDEVWAAAGTWRDVFGIEPKRAVSSRRVPGRRDRKRG